MQTKTTRINGRDLGNQVAEQIARELFSGAYKPGDMLPPETDLAERLAVSRASVRSGLQTLTALGIIRRQAGKGTVVEETREWNMLDPLVSRWMIEYASPNPDFFRDIYEYRRAIEPYVSALAANRATAQDLASIERAYDGMARGLKEGSTEQFTQADVAFHTAIYRATHNLIWAQSANILRPAIMLVIEKSNDTAEELSESLENHRRLMECIRLRQPEAAFEAALKVMQRTATDLGITTSQVDDESIALIRAESLSGID
ncbi:MAG: FadR family transcriptional regulator [Chromatiaceae bacterium]|nr:FadR family transcriptional regulator [Gammaproteobacteria bacterium]MCB1880920.1 FadR family transcriptional regulator [Gammaproteobacteria bacterium]MCP5428490.1 FadR family transcriptional regulator [Chromatiaceae bacterium]MCP5447425.1 FadR family transcriptional regulator [Chromatiaceae bacterium]